MSSLGLIIASSLLTLRILWIGPWPPQVDTVQTFWPNGQLKSEYFLLNHSEQEGDSSWSIIDWHRTWHENGQLHEQLLYDDGFPQGFYTSYHPNGMLKEQGQMSVEKYGVWIKWYEDGTRAEETIFPILGQYSRKSTWFPDGKLKSVTNSHRGKYHGHCFWAKSDDHEKLDGFYFEDVLMAHLDSLQYAHKFYHPGELYNSGADLWIEWDEAMSNVWIGRKNNGIKTGDWTHFLPNGDVVIEKY